MDSACSSADTTTFQLNLVLIVCNKKISGNDKFLFLILIMAVLAYEGRCQPLLNNSVLECGLSPFNQ